MVDASVPSSTIVFCILRSSSSSAKALSVGRQKQFSSVRAQLQRSPLSNPAPVTGCASVAQSDSQIEGRRAIHPRACIAAGLPTHDAATVAGAREH